MGDTGITYDGFFPALLDAVPEFAPRYEKCVAEYGALSPHVFLGEFTRFFVEQVRQSRNGGKAADNAVSIIARSVQFLDKALASYDEKTFGNERETLHNLIAVSFVENLLGMEGYDRVKASLSDQLRRQLEQLE